MELREGYKQTEVGTIPDDWSVMTLLNVCSKITDGTHDTPKPVEQGVPFLTAIHVKENQIDFDKAYFLPKKIHDEIYKRCNPQKNDVLMVNIGAGVATTSLVDVDYEFSLKNVALLKPEKAKLSGRYLSFYQSTVKRKITESISTGGAQPFLSLTQIGQLKIALPPTKAEQTAIANALSDTDAWIQSLTRLIAKKRQIKQGAMQTLLNPYENGQLKEGWIVKKLGDVANIFRGASPRPIDSPVWFDDSSAVGWVRISDVTRSKKYLTETMQKLSEQGIKQSRFVPMDSLIMSICATVGRPILTMMDVCIHDGFVRFENCAVDKQFLYYFLSFIEPEWSKNGQTGSQMNLNTTLINETTFPVPSEVTEQTRIATILSDIDNEITALETKLAKAKTIKQGMMQNLLTGRIRLI